MKFVKEEISGKERTRYMFSLGKSEAVVLHALLAKAVEYMPRTIKTQTTEQRMRNMLNEIRKAIPKMEAQKDDYEI